MTGLLILFAVALSPLFYGWRIRLSGHPAAAAPAPATAPLPASPLRAMIRLTLTEPEARIIRSLLGLGACAAWPDHVARDLEARSRTELERLAGVIPKARVVETASFYWDQLSLWLCDRTPVGAGL